MRWTSLKYAILKSMEKILPYAPQVKELVWMGPGDGSPVPEQHCLSSFHLPSSPAPSCSPAAALLLPHEPPTGFAAVVGRAQDPTAAQHRRSHTRQAAPENQLQPLLLVFEIL